MNIPAGWTLCGTITASSGASYRAYRDHNGAGDGVLLERNGELVKRVEGAIVGAERNAWAKIVNLVQECERETA